MSLYGNPIMTCQYDSPRFSNLPHIADPTYVYVNTYLTRVNFVNYKNMNKRKKWIGHKYVSFLTMYNVYISTCLEHVLLKQAL